MDELKKETIKQLIEAIKQKNPEDWLKIDALSRLLSTILYDERDKKRKT